MRIVDKRSFYIALVSQIVILSCMIALVAVIIIVYNSNIKIGWWFLVIFVVDFILFYISTRITDWRGEKKWRILRQEEIDTYGKEYFDK